MIQLYTRIFTQILSSSIAEDWRVRHIFEDFLKLCDPKTGVVDMTRQSISRQLNIPIEEINRAITILEAPDKDSRDPADAGCRLKRLDDHRDWGWIILNWEKYEGLRCRKDVSDRVALHRSKKPDVDEEKFNQFWAAYPRKVCKCDAARAFSKVKVPVEDLVKALDLQKKCDQWVKDDGRFIPYPASWLNASRWTDEVKPSIPHAPNLGNRSLVDRNAGTCFDAARHQAAIVKLQARRKEETDKLVADIAARRKAADEKESHVNTV